MPIQLSDREFPSTVEERKLNGKIPYASSVGSIMYAMVATRTDLAYVVGVVRPYMSNPGWKLWEAVKHILRYLRGTKDTQLTFGSNNSTKVKSYADSDYVGNTDNWKSTSGYVFTYGGGAISWRSKLQECTTLSTTWADRVHSSIRRNEASRVATSTVSRLLGEKMTPPSIVTPIAQYTSSKIQSIARRRNISRYGFITSWSS